MSSYKSIVLDLPSGADDLKLDGVDGNTKDTLGSFNTKDVHTEKESKIFDQDPLPPIVDEFAMSKGTKKQFFPFFEGRRAKQKKIVFASFAILLFVATVLWVFSLRGSYFDMSLVDKDSLFAFDLYESEADEIGTELPVLLMVQSSLKQATRQTSKLATSQDNNITETLIEANGLLDVVIADIRAREEQTQKLRERLQTLRFQNAAFETERRLQNNRIASLIPYKDKYIESRDKLRLSNNDVIALRAEARRVDMRLKNVAEEYAKLQINFEEQLDEQLAIYRQELKANQEVANSIPIGDAQLLSTPEEQAQELAFLNNSLEIMRKDLASVRHEHRLALIELENLRAREAQRLKDETLR